jgi:hypothetical protein
MDQALKIAVGYGAAPDFGRSLVSLVNQTFANVEKNQTLIGMANVHVASDSHHVWIDFLEVHAFTASADSIKHTLPL